MQSSSLIEEAKRQRAFCCIFLDQNWLVIVLASICVEMDRILDCRKLQPQQNEQINWHWHQNINNKSERQNIAIIMRKLFENQNFYLFSSNAYFNTSQTQANSVTLSSFYNLVILISCHFIFLQLNQQRLLLRKMHTSLTFPIIPHRIYNPQTKALPQYIEKMYLNYHNAAYSLLEDHITFNERAEYLKRQYESYQFAGKIAMLSEYYQYHRELPRIFQKELHSIIANYQEDVRNQEYQLVTRKLKEGSYEEVMLTERERRRPVEKVIKNIELSYYNFENKEVKKSKEHRPPTLKNNKKSMPALPLYQHAQKPPTTHHALKASINQPPLQPLKAKDTNKLSIKSRSKEQFKKPSLNNSTDSPKNLSRSKSKSNLAMLHPEALSKRNSKPLQQPAIPSKAKSNPVSLQKTSSSKNFLRREDPKKPKQNMLGSVGIGVMAGADKDGLKSMFKRAMQTKKLIKIAR